MAKVNCPRCNGAGDHVVVEDGREVLEACYRCGQTGYVDEVLSKETIREDRIQDLVGVIAHRNVSAAEKACQNDEDGEDWAFAAAENMMTLHDYRQSREYGEMIAVEEELKKLAPWMVDALLELVVPEPAPQVELVAVQEYPGPEIMDGFPDALDDLDIPF